ncbi:MAG: hypothetical protein COB17_10555 [Sulfurimonas sp.]|nr:MAG: hypothetical protein COB17_10555 [Sulfurimonas sp.]
MNTNAENISRLSSDSLEVRSSLQGTIESMDKTADISERFSKNITKTEVLNETIHEVERLTTGCFSSIDEIIESIDNLVENTQELNKELNIFKT